MVTRVKIAPGLEWGIGYTFFFTHFLGLKFLEYKGSPEKKEAFEKPSLWDISIPIYKRG